MDLPTDYVCDICGSDDVGGIIEARELINGPDAGKLEPWSECYDYYKCGSCTHGECGIVLRKDFAESHNLNNIWASVSQDWEGGLTVFTVKVYHPNGERVGVWRGASPDDLVQTEGPPSIVLSDVCNLDHAFGLVY